MSSQIPVSGCTFFSRPGFQSLLLIVLLLLVCNNPRIMQDRRNGPAANVFGWLAAILMAAAAAIMIWGMATGKGS